MSDRSPEFKKWRGTGPTSGYSRDIKAWHRETETLWECWRAAQADMDCESCTMQSIELLNGQLAEALHSEVELKEKCELHESEFKRVHYALNKRAVERDNLRIKLREATELNRLHEEEIDFKVHKIEKLKEESAQLKTQLGYKTITR